SCRGRPRARARRRRSRAAPRIARAAPRTARARSLRACRRRTGWLDREVPDRSKGDRSCALLAQPFERDTQSGQPAADAGLDGAERLAERLRDLDVTQAPEE